MSASRRSSGAFGGRPIFMAINHIHSNFGIKPDFLLSRHTYCAYNKYIEKKTPEGRQSNRGEPKPDVSARFQPKQLNCSGFVAANQANPMSNVMKPEKRVQILRMLAEGNSVRSTARLMQTNIPTVLRQLVKAGEECRQFMHANLVDLNVRHAQLDEQWTFCAKKQRRLTPEEAGNPALGDQFLFIALDTDTKLICTYALGKRDMEQPNDSLTTCTVAW